MESIYHPYHEVNNLIDDEKKPSKLILTPDEFIEFLYGLMRFGKLGKLEILEKYTSCSDSTEFQFVSVDTPASRNKYLPDLSTGRLSVESSNDDEARLLSIMLTPRGIDRLNELYADKISNKDVIFVYRDTLIEIKS